MLRFLTFSCLVVAAKTAAPVAAQAFVIPQPDDVKPPSPGTGPRLACTAAELARLRAAYAARQPILVRLVASARTRLAQTVHFPPRGGQHNQWYQCERCEMGLQTLGPSRHRCPKCAKIYSGPPYDDVVFSRVHGRNCQRAHDAAWAYALSGRDEFAADAVAILTGYADRYEQYPYHTNSRDGSSKRSGGGHIEEQSLSEASLMIGSVLPACDLLWATLTERQRSHLSSHLIRPMVENLGRSRRGKSNWQTFHNAAMFYGGALLADARWMQRSIFDAKNGFLFQMQHCVSPDGMWFENSWGYHLYTLRALVAHAEVARRCGVDLWGHLTMRRLIELPLEYTMPDGSLPRFGDDVNSSTERARVLFETAHPVLGTNPLRATRTASFARLLRGVEVDGTSLLQLPQSRVFRGAGHAILRSSGNGLCAVLTFGPFGGFHGHFDKLSFVFYGHGVELGVDPGRARSQAYRLSIHKNWYRATIAHNAVVVDGRSQRGATGELLLFETKHGCAAAAARTDAAYPGVRHERCLILARGYLVVLDLLTSVKDHRFDWLYHNRGTGVRTEVTTRPSESGLGLRGEEYLADIAVGETRDAADAVFTGERVSLRVLLAAGGPTRLATATGVGASVTERVPVLFARRSGRRVVFAAVLEPFENGATPKVAAIRCQDRDGTLRVRVQRGRQTDEFRWSGSRLQLSPAELPRRR